MSILHEKKGAPSSPRGTEIPKADQVIEVDEQGKVTVPGEEKEIERRRGVAVALPEQLAEYLRVLCAATKTPIKCALAELSRSEELKAAVEAYGQKMVADHVREVQAKLGAKRPEGA